MSYLRSLNADAGLLQIFKLFRKQRGHCWNITKRCWAESPFSAAERELIAAYVSGP
jgi:hypothetical protein